MYLQLLNHLLVIDIRRFLFDFFFNRIDSCSSTITTTNSSSSEFKQCHCLATVLSTILVISLFSPSNKHKIHLVLLKAISTTTTTANWCATTSCSTCISPSSTRFAKFISYPTLNFHVQGAATAPKQPPAAGSTAPNTQDPTMSQANSEAWAQYWYFSSNHSQLFH